MGGQDHTVPEAITKSTLRQYRHSDAVNDLIEFPDRGHSLTIDHGWRDVASTCLDWLAQRGSVAGRVQIQPAATPDTRGARMSDRILADHTGVALTTESPGSTAWRSTMRSAAPARRCSSCTASQAMPYWRHVVPLLTPHYTVITVDTRGFGGSQRPPSGYDTATMARDVADLATYLGFDQFRVAGQDWAPPSPTHWRRSTARGCSSSSSRRPCCQVAD